MLMGEGKYTVVIPGAQSLCHKIFPQMNVYLEFNNTCSFKNIYMISGF